MRFLMIDRIADVEPGVSARGWKRPPEFGQVLGQAAQQALSAGKPDSIFLLGYLDGDPVGIAILRMLPYAGYMQGAAVVPEARGRGMYRALTWHRLDLIADAGLRQAAIWANVETAAPIARAIGFRRVCGAVFHELEPAPA